MLDASPDKTSLPHMVSPTYLTSPLDLQSGTLSALASLSEDPHRLRHGAYIGFETERFLKSAAKA